MKSIKSSAFQPAFSWCHFFVQTLVVGYTERLGSLAVWVRAERLTKHRNIHHLESFSETKMFQSVQFECLPGALWSREVETLRMEPEPTVQRCSCADATKSQQRSKALISVYDYNYSTKLTNLKAKSILLFWAHFAHFYQIVIESILSFGVMRL